MPNLAKLVQHSTLWTLAILLLLPMVACEPEDPVQRIVDLRSKYVVQVNPSGLVAQPHEEEVIETEALDNADMEMEGNQVVDEVVVAAEAPEEVVDAADADADADGEEMGEDMDGEEMEEVDVEPTGYDVLLDILLQNTSNDTLPQLTMDIVQTDRSENEVARFYHTVDTSKLLKGMDTQLSHKLVNIPYDPANHMFYVEIRDDIPEGDMALYPEFESVTGSSN